MYIKKYFRIETKKGKIKNIILNKNYDSKRKKKYKT